MSAPPLPGRPPNAPMRRPAGFAIPARLHVFVLFMIQFIVMIGLLGGVVPALYRDGVNPILLGLGAVAGLLGLHLGLGAIARVVPVRCRPCGAATRFAGFGWWPFIYRYPCGACGQTTRLEISG